MEITIFNKKLLIILLVCSTFSALAQNETRPVQVKKYGTGEIEEYNVLVTDKKVRHGLYVQYLPSSFAGTVIFETGNYDHNLKQGEWRTFSRNKPWNKLLSKGSYQAGVQEGIWSYYQPNLREGPFPWSSDKSVVRQAVANGADAKSGYSVNIDDNTAVLQAEGLYAQGVRVGVWTYFNRNAQVIQKINHFTNELLYWHPEGEAAKSGKEVTLNHPALYVGDKGLLSVEIYSALSPESVVSLGESVESEFVFSLDEHGKQLDLTLANKAAPTRYEKMLLATLVKMPTRWLPRVVDGKPCPSSYHIRIVTRKEVVDAENTVGIKVDLLGEAI
jgi:hypothetical protein